jgi:hypothetical protein
MRKPWKNLPTAVFSGFHALAVLRHLSTSWCMAQGETAFVNDRVSLLTISIDLARNLNGVAKKKIVQVAQMRRKLVT